MTYEITFHEVPEYGYTNVIELGMLPAYMGEYNNDPQNPSINYDMVKNSRHWDYEYWELQDGDKVEFIPITQGNWYYTMSITIDGTEVSSKTIYSGGLIEQSGWNDSDTNSYIEFIYNE
jgi:hypothetical protein